MTWFKVDDNLAFHRKTLKAGNAAMGMWVRAGAEVAQQLLDGFVPDEMVVLLGGHTLARKLTFADLWVRVDGGYLFHEWGERNPTRAEVEAERKAAKARKERWRERREERVPEPVPNGRENGVGTPTHTRAATRPDPTRPEEPKSRGRATRFTRDLITDEWRDYARTAGFTDPGVTRMLDDFADYWTARAGRDGSKLDWLATWRRWVRNEADRNPPRVAASAGIWEPS